MKQKIFFFAILALTAFSQIIADDIPIKDDPNRPGTRIYSTTLSATSTFSVTASPVVVSYSASTLTIEFLDNLGAVNITVSDNAGTAVFQESIKAIKNKAEKISTGTWAPGTYTVTIQSATTTYVESFTI